MLDAWAEEEKEEGGSSSRFLGSGDSEGEARAEGIRRRDSTVVLSAVD